MEASMTTFDITTLGSVVQTFDQSNDDIEDDGGQWAVIVRPPEDCETAREDAERLFADLHGHSRISFEILSDGADATLQIVVNDRATADTIARHSREVLGADARVVPATMPIESDDPIASATFGYEKDAIYPLATTRTSDRDTGPLHHVLDTLAAEEVRGCYQVVAEPVEGDWTERRSRGLPDSIPEERDMEMEQRRAGMAMIPTLVVSFWISPWPMETASVVALGLLVAMTVGEGVRLPQQQTGEDLAREHRSKTKDAHGASSTQGKQAEETAEAIIEQSHSPGWRVSVRLIVAGDTTADSVRHRDRLVTQIERAYASDVTGQELVATTESGEKARETLERVRSREADQTQPIEHAHRLLAHGTRRSMHVAPFELGSLAYFPGEDGGGGDVRDFVDSDSRETTEVNAAVPAYSREDDREEPDLDFNIDPDSNIEYQHQQYGTIESNVVEEAEGTADDDHYAGAFARELIESKREQPQDALYLGHVEDGQQTREIGVPYGNLDRHIVITGASGNGKSTLLKAICAQHAWAGRGFVVNDPHNEFIEELVEILPAHRKDDVVYVDPGGVHDQVVALNPLDVHADPDERRYEEVVNGRVSDIIGVLKVSGRMGPKMEPNAKTLLRGMIKSQKDYTLVDMHDMLVEPAKREAFADRMEAEGQVVATSARKIANMDNSDLDALARRLNDWVQSPTCRRIIDNEEASISWKEAVEQNKIILVKNKLADEAMQQLLATLVVQGVWRAAIDRPKDDRPLFPIMVDEVDNILTPELDMGTKLADGRKFGVSLTLLTQFPSRIESIKKDIGNNCKTFVSFELPWPDEAKPVADLFQCDKSRIQDIAKFHAMVEIEADGAKSGPHIMQTYPDYPSIRTKAKAQDEIVQPALDRDGVEIVEDWEGDEAVLDDDDEDDETDLLDEFLAEVEAAVHEGRLEEDQQYRIVHAGKSNEELRINASRVCEAIDIDWLDGPSEVSSRAKELVDDDASAVVAHSKPSGSINRAIGIDSSMAEISI